MPSPRGDENRSPRRAGAGALRRVSPRRVARRAVFPAHRDAEEDPLTFIRHEDTLLGVQHGDTAQRLYGAAVTSARRPLRCTFTISQTGALLHTGSALNGQIRYGADVIARIQHAIEHENGLAELNRAILDTIDLPSRRGHPPCWAFRRSLQLRFLRQQHDAASLGIDPSALGAEPFMSVTADTVRAPAGEIGLSKLPRGRSWSFLPPLGGLSARIRPPCCGVPGRRASCRRSRHERGRSPSATRATASSPLHRLRPRARGRQYRVRHARRGGRGIDHVEINAGRRASLHVLGGARRRVSAAPAHIDMTAALVRCGLVDMTGRLLPRGEFAAEHPDSPLLDRLEPVGEYNNAFFLRAAASIRSIFRRTISARSSSLKSSICAGCLTPATSTASSRAARFTHSRRGVRKLHRCGQRFVHRSLPPRRARRSLAVGNGAGSGVCRYLSTARRAPAAGTSAPSRATWSPTPAPKLGAIHHET